MIRRRFHIAHPKLEEEVDTCKKHFTEKLRESHYNSEKEFDKALKTLKLETRRRGHDVGAWNPEAAEFFGKINVKFACLEKKSAL